MENNQKDKMISELEEMLEKIMTISYDPADGGNLDAASINSLANKCLRLVKSIKTVD